MLASRLQLLPLLIFVCSVTAAGQTTSSQYTITELGNFTARSLNNSGTVTGSMGNKAVLFRNGVITDITPVDGVIAEANRINDLDQVAGRVFFCDMVGGNCVNGRTRAFVFDRGASTVLGTFGGRDSVALGINNAGQVVGWSHTAGPTPGTSGDEHAFIFQNGVMQDIGLQTTSRGTWASNINQAGQVSGWARGSSSNLSDHGAYLYSGGTFQFFAQNGGLASDINNAGEVVGSMGGNDDGSRQAFLFSGGVLKDLGNFSQNKSAQALAINNAGQVVGISSPSFPNSTGEQAFIFSAGVIQNLNNLIAANSGWVLSQAVDINDAGQIAGNGFKNGEPRAFLLTPTQPLLVTEANSTKAIVLESIVFFRDPFTLLPRHFLSTDGRTRLTILAQNIEIIAGENLPPPTVQAENAQHQLIDLPVEFVGKVPGATWLTQITVRLPDQLNTAGEIQLRISYRGRTSNAGSFTLATSP
jgi:probable HAF family extracellular repeat protein